MAVQITQTLAVGDGTYQVWGRNPGGQMAHVIVGLDKVQDGSVYLMLQLAADKLDTKARNLELQSTLDTSQD